VSRRAIASLAEPTAAAAERVVLRKMLQDACAAIDWCADQLAIAGKLPEATRARERGRTLEYDARAAHARLEAIEARRAREAIDAPRRLPGGTS